MVFSLDEFLDPAEHGVLSHTGVPGISAPMFGDGNLGDFTLNAGVNSDVQGERHYLSLTIETGATLAAVARSKLIVRVQNNCILQGTGAIHADGRGVIGPTGGPGGNGGGGNGGAGSNAATGISNAASGGAGGGGGAGGANTEFLTGSFGGAGGSGGNTVNRSSFLDSAGSIVGGVGANPTPGNTGSSSGIPPAPGSALPGLAAGSTTAFAASAKARWLDSDSAMLTLLLEGSPGSGGGGGAGGVLLQASTQTGLGGAGGLSGSQAGNGLGSGIGGAQAADVAYLNNGQDPQSGGGGGGAGGAGGGALDLFVGADLTLGVSARVSANGGPGGAGGRGGDTGGFSFSDPAAGGGGGGGGGGSGGVLRVFWAGIGTNVGPSNIGANGGVGGGAGRGGITNDALSTEAYGATGAIGQPGEHGWSLARKI